MPLYHYVQTMPKPIRQVAESMDIDWTGRVEHSITFAVETLRHMSSSARLQVFWQQVYDHYKHGSPLPTVAEIQEPKDFLIPEGTRSKVAMVREVFYQNPGREMTSNEIADILNEYDISITQIREKLSYLRDKREIFVIGKEIFEGFDRRKNLKVYKITPDG